MTDTKREQLRADMRRRRAAIGPRERALASRAIAEHLSASEIYLAARNIGAYLALRQEADPAPLVAHALAQNKQVYVPVIDIAPDPGMTFARIDANTPLTRNRFGIDEPAPNHRETLAAQKLDLVLLPLIAFDSSGNRLGMGAGYYDRCFSFLREPGINRGPILCGVGYSCQQLEQITPQDWDVPLHLVVTEDGILQAKTGKNER